MYLDYLTELEEQIKDGRDLVAIDNMREICKTAVLDHVQKVNSTAAIMVD